MVCQDRAGEREYLGEPCRAKPSERTPSNRRCANAAAYGPIGNHLQELPATAYDTILRPQSVPERRSRVHVPPG
jgi:hypothetical protein